jgi:Domain of unknown function (DUF4440)
MRFNLSVLLLFSYCQLFAQHDVLNNKVEQLHSALVKKDSVMLQYLLHDSVSYGHSNGLIENKTSIWKNLKSSYIQYHDIKYSNLKIQIYKNTAIVRYNAEINVDFESKNYKLTLHTLQTWQRRGKNWQIIARQATKINL